MLSPEQAEAFFSIDEEERIGMPIKTKGELSNGTIYNFNGVVESYTVGYGEVYLICEGEEVFE